MNLTKRNFVAFGYYRSQRRREKRREARGRKRRCPPAPPPSPATPPPPSPASPPPPPAPSRLPLPPLPRSRTLAPAPAQSQHPILAPPRSQTPERPLSRSPAHPNKVKRKSAVVRAYAFNSSDSDYSPDADSNKSDSDFSTPRKRTKMFSNDDEIKILRGLLYMNKNNDKKTWVTDEVAEHINRSLRRNADFTKTQFRHKIRGMKNKYNKNRDKEGQFYKMCAKIWGDNEEEQPMNSSSTRVLFENDTDVVDFTDESNVDSLYVEDSYAEDLDNNNEHHDNNEEGNDSIAGRRAEIKRKFKELDIMTLQLSLKRLALMKETIGTVLEVIQ